MPKVLEEIDLDAEELDAEQAQLTEAEQRAAQAMFSHTSPEHVGDLSDGGVVNGATLYPSQGGQRQVKGRPTVIRAWMWNGTPSFIPLAFNPQGTRHDRGRPYFEKMQCLCCMDGGFKSRQCPKCVKSNCRDCGGSTDRKKVIRSFYRRLEDVPFPRVIDASVDCFLPSCPRRNGRGFPTEQDMRMHGRTKHRLEYQSFIESQNSRDRDELASLRSRLDSIQAAPNGVATQTRRRTRKPKSPSTRTPWEKTNSLGNTKE